MSGSSLERLEGESPGYRLSAFATPCPLRLLSVRKTIYATIKKTMAYWVALAKAQPTDRRKSLSPFCEATSDTMSSFELHVARELLTSWSKSREGSPRCVQTGTRDIQGKAVGTGFFQPGEEEGTNLAAVSLHKGQHKEVIIIRIQKIHCRGICPLPIYQNCPSPAGMVNSFLHHQFCSVPCVQETAQRTSVHFVPGHIGILWQS